MACSVRASIRHESTQLVVKRSTLAGENTYFNGGLTKQAPNVRENHLAVIFNEPHIIAVIYEIEYHSIQMDSHHQPVFF